MKKAAVLMAALCAACIAGAAQVNLATQEWVQRVLAAQGMRVSLGTVSTNVVTESGQTVTNFVFTSPFHPPDNTNCVGLSLTFSTPSVGHAPSTVSLRDLMFPRLFAAFGDDRYIIATLKSGAWTDRRGIPHPFTLSGGRTFWRTDDSLPEMPSSGHVCQIGADCCCVDMGKTAEDIEIPEDYLERDVSTLDDWTSSWSEWIPSTWPDWQDVNGVSVPVLYDDDGQFFLMSSIIKTDAWADAVGLAWQSANLYLLECQAAYTLSHICTAENPQHIWATRSCGANTWKVCQRNAAHMEGAERHAYASGSAGEGGHYCICGQGPTEGHAIATERVPTAGGFRLRRYCTVAGCGWEQMDEEEHIHTFVDCQPCECGEKCSCDGNHVWGLKEGSECHKCVCSSSPNCSAHAPHATQADRDAYHGGWKPCGEDRIELEGDEIVIHADNWDGGAAGAHCQCNCTAYGHDHNTSHQFTPGSGTPSYQEYDSTRHKQVEGPGTRSCSYCGLAIGLLEEHTPSDDEDAIFWKWVSNDGCMKVTPCVRWEQGCTFLFEGEGGDGNISPHVEDDGSPVWWTDSSSEVCTKHATCKNCGRSFSAAGVHEPDPANHCMCAHNCGRQCAHTFPAEANACGVKVCEVCGFQDGDSHTGWTDEGSTHVCACGLMHKDHDDDGPRTWKAKGGVDVAIYTWSCSKCDHTHDVEEACTHSFDYTAPARTEIDGDEYVDYFPCALCDREDTRRRPMEQLECSGSSHVANTNGTCGCVCGYYPNTATGDAEWHVWNGEGCLCSCGKYHQAKGWSTYSVNAGKACPGVCSSCLKYSASGPVDGLTEAGEDAHTPARAGKCGCACGKLDHGAEDGRFHIQKPGTCRCWGADGNGGAWHFPCPRGDCTAICLYSTGGDEHLAVSAKVKADNVTASPDDHTQDPSFCRCKCGRYHKDGAGWDFHVYASEQACECVCQDRNRHEFTGDLHYLRATPGWLYYQRMCVRGCGTWGGAEIKKPCEHEWELVGRAPAGLPGVYRLTYRCKICELTKTEIEGSAEDLGCVGDVHLPKSGACGCVCGHYGNGNPSSDSRYHVRKSGCECACGLYHFAQNWSRADVTAGRSCHGVCASCNIRKNISGLKSSISSPDLSDHDPKTGRCGCCCGKVDIDNAGAEYLRFHPKHSSSCRCCGPEGKGDGAWHYVVKDGSCTKLCGHREKDGGRHLVASTQSGVKAVRETWRAAVPTDHTPATSSCGCRCGDISPGTTAGRKHLNVKDGGEYIFHKWADNHCICMCGYCPEHKGFPSACPNVCGGFLRDGYRSASEHYCPGIVGSAAVRSPLDKTNLDKTKHTPNEDACGCKCGDTRLGGGGGSEYVGKDEYARFHRYAEGECFCKCGARHSRKGPDACGWCTKCQGTKTAGEKWSSEITHPAFGSVKNHPFADNMCTNCMAGHGFTREHVYPNSPAREVGQAYTCEVCNNRVTPYADIYYCSRCNMELRREGWEEGHADDCGKEGEHQDPRDDPDVCKGCGSRCVNQQHPAGKPCPVSGQYCAKCAPEGGGGDNPNGNSSDIEGDGGSDTPPTDLDPDELWRWINEHFWD